MYLLLNKNVCYIYKGLKKGNMEVGERMRFKRTPITKLDGSQPNWHDECTSVVPRTNVYNDWSHFIVNEIQLGP
ncbi:uncharacterized protein DS421_5g137850 [Arachis hypogaea]|nr:uncharacterized protein DS421_5g137850 [Arachis hypogaea]